MFCICAFRLFSFKTGWFSLIGIICCSFMLNQRISYIYTYLFQQLYSLACIYSDFYFLQSLWSENGEQQISYSVDDCWIFFFFFFFFFLPFIWNSRQAAFKWQLEFSYNFTLSSQTVINKSAQTYWIYKKKISLAQKINWN